MKSRLELGEIFKEILGTIGQAETRVYFQPPESTQIKYPAIIYGLNIIENSFADDGVYSSNKQYLVTLIDRNPDNHFIDKINSLPKCRFDRHYKKDNLNHYVFTLFF